jgi:hypothetical protein
MKAADYKDLREIPTEYVVERPRLVERESIENTLHRFALQRSSAPHAPRS